MAPDALALNQTNKFILDDLNSNSDDEMTFNQHIKKKAPEQKLVPEEEDDFTRATRESIAALQRQRGGSFRAAAAKRTVADFQTDSSESESEEDPDDEPAPKPSSETETGEGVPAINGVNPDKHDDETAAPRPATNSSSRRKPSASEKRSALQPQTAADDDRIVWLYTIFEQSTINGIPSPPKKLEFSEYLCRNDATRWAAYRFQQHRSSNTSSVRFVEEISGGEDIYHGKLYFDSEKKNGIDVFIEKFPKAPKEIDNFDPAKVPEVVPVKLWGLVLTTTSKDGLINKNFIPTNPDKPEGRKKIFSTLDMANHEACHELLEIIKPRSSILDYINQYATDVAPPIRQARDDCKDAKDEDGNPIEKTFDAELDLQGEGKLDWIEEFIAVQVHVEEFQLVGPKN
jgi:hypothetical protein